MKEKVNRIHIDGHEQPRVLHKDTSVAPSTADFCAVCGHWTSRPTVTADNKKCCSSCSKRVSQLTR